MRKELLETLLAVILGYLQDIDHENMLVFSWRENIGFLSGWKLSVAMFNAEWQIPGHLEEERTVHFSFSTMGYFPPKETRNLLSSGNVLHLF